MTGERQAGSRAAAREMAVFAVVLAATLAVAGALALHAMNPDGIAYIRLARYWRAGNVALAVNGYWSPLFPWMIALFDGGPDTPLPTLGARVAMAVSGWLFGMAGMLWLRDTLPRRGERILGGIILVLVTADWSTATITPDLLLAGWMVLAAWIFGRGRWVGARGPAFAAGLCLGAAFLTKAVALPTGLLLLAACCVLEMLRGAGRRVVLASGLWALLGLLVPAGPQIASVSIHYGRPVFSSAGRINHALVGPDAPADHPFIDHPFMLHYYQVPEGRVTTWEDPGEETYADWSPVASAANMVLQLRIVFRNIQFALSSLRIFDALCLGVVGAVVALLTLLAGRNGRRQVVAAALIVATVLPYLPVYAPDVRYYLAAVPMLLHLAFVTGCAIWAGLFSGWRLGPALGAVLVALSFGFGALPGAARTFLGRADPSYVQAEALNATLRRMQLPPGGTAALGVRNTAALYLAFLQGTAYHGQRLHLADPRELLQSGARTVLVTQASEQDIAVLMLMGTELFTGVPGLRVFRLAG